MSAIDPLLHAGAKAKGKRPWFLQDGEVERLLNITLALAQEVAVLRERQDTLERLLARGERVSPEAIDAFAPSRQEAAERGRWTQEYLARLFRILQQDREAIPLAQEPSSEEVAQDLAQP